MRVWGRVCTLLRVRLLLLHALQVTQAQSQAQQQCLATSSLGDISGVRVTEGRQLGRRHVMQSDIGDLDS